jgi:serine/threonine-protein kinase RsbW
LFTDRHIIPSDIEDLILAIEEALTNVFEHGYGGKSNVDCPVRIEILSNKQEVYIILADLAKPFNLDSSEATNINTYINSQKIGGFGITIIKKLMNNVRSFQLFDENVLIMQKIVHYNRKSANRILL